MWTVRQAPAEARPPLQLRRMASISLRRFSNSDNADGPGRAGAPARVDEENERAGLLL